MAKTAIILAGGFGTRLQALVKDVPKPMALVNGRPFLEYHLKKLAAFGYTNVILSTGYLAGVIQQHFKNGFEGLTINFSHEEQPLGTGGGMRQALTACEADQCLVVNGDSFFDIDLLQFENLAAGAGTVHSIALRPVPDVSRYGAVSIDEQGRITSFGEKTGQSKPGLINAGMYLLSTSHFLANTPAATNFSVEHDFFTPLSGSGQISGFPFEGYFIDIGLPEDYLTAQDDFKRFAY